MMCSYLDELQKLFESSCKQIADCFKEAFDKTEKDLGYPMDEDTKKLCFLFGMLRLFSDYEKDN